MPTNASWVTRNAVREHLDRMIIVTAIKAASRVANEPANCYRLPGKYTWRHREGRHVDKFNK